MLLFLAKCGVLGVRRFFLLADKDLGDLAKRHRTCVGARAVAHMPPVGPVAFRKGPPVNLATGRRLWLELPQAVPSVRGLAPRPRRGPLS